MRAVSWYVLNLSLQCQLISGTMRIPSDTKNHTSQFIQVTTTTTKTTATTTTTTTTTTTIIIIIIIILVGVWAHGDFCKISSRTGGIVMLGRRYSSSCCICFEFILFFSDGTLNPSGVRFGSAEIYNISKMNK